MIDPTDPIVSSNVPEIGKKVDSIPVSDVMTAMAQLEQELKEFFLLEAATMQDRIDEVHALHKKINYDDLKVCEYCSVFKFKDDPNEFEILANYPCDTVRILDGNNNE